MHKFNILHFNEPHINHQVHAVAALKSHNTPSASSVLRQIADLLSELRSDFKSQNGLDCSRKSFVTVTVDSALTKETVKMYFQVS